LPMVE
jgi:hypothetical protein